MKRYKNSGVADSDMDPVPGERSLSNDVFSMGRVLLVDDEPLVLEMFESLLSQEGYDVFVAATARDALYQIEKSFFDSIVCDIRLDELDGFDIVEIARKRSPGIGVVFITGAPSDVDSQRASSANAAYLSKPISLKVLISSVADSIPSSMAVTGATAGRRLASG